MKFEELVNIASIQIGRTPKRAVHDYWGKGHPWVSISDMTKYEITETKEEITEAAVKECRCKLIPKGTLLMSFKLSIGKLAFAGRDLYTNEAICGISINNNDKISSKYLYYALKNTKLIGSNVAVKGATLNTASLNALKIPIVGDKDIQLHIANILSKAESLIAQRKESIRLLDEYLKSVFLEMFGDPVRNEKGWNKLSGIEYFEKLTVGVVIKPASYYVHEGVIALRSLNIRPNKIVLNDLVYFSEEVNQKKLSKSILHEGDVVFVRTGMTGTAAIIPKELDGCNCIDLIITRPKNGVINPQYLVFFFNSDIGKRIVVSNEVGGIQKHFNIGAIRKLEIPVPPINLQTHFAQIVEKTETLKALYQQSLQELENLYGSLSQKAFKGELNLKDNEMLMAAESGLSIKNRNQ